MDESVNIYEAKTRLSELVTRAAGGEEIILARNGRPAAKLGPLDERTMTLEEACAARGFGIDKGLIHISDDFDAPVPALEAFFS
jgi:prevent-host-death family protein